MRAVRIVRKRQKSNPKNFKIIKSYLTDHLSINNFLMSTVNHTTNIFCKRIHFVLREISANNEKVIGPLSQ
jgi:hypothetical protein